MKRSVAIFLSSLAAIVVLFAGGWVVYTFPPAEHSFYPRCLFKTATGYDCPGCGSTRALHHLLHGRVEEAFLLNPLLFVMMGVALCAVPSLLRGNQPAFLTKTWFGWATVIVVGGWWIVRNL